MMRIAFLGFRHGHIHSLYSLAEQHSGITIVAAAEDDAEARAAAEAKGIAITHTSIDELLDSVDCDAVALGDYYQRRGGHAIRALERGLHVIADKPLCTSLEELDRIEQLAKEKNKAIGCMLTCRNAGIVHALRKSIQDGDIGAIQAITYDGQHPMLYGTRPGWYFEEGKQGGTLNDITIHATDLIPWVTGVPYAKIEAARTWSTGRIDNPYFHDGAHVMATLVNGASVMGDVSYLTPDSFGYTMPHYWQFLFWGTEGLLELRLNRQELTLYKNGEKEARSIDPLVDQPSAYLDGFIAATEGQTHPFGPSTDDVIRATRVALTSQKAADAAQYGISIGA